MKKSLSKYRLPNPLTHAPPFGEAERSTMKPIKNCYICGVPMPYGYTVDRNDRELCSECAVAEREISDALDEIEIEEVEK